MTPSSPATTLPYLLFKNSLKMFQKPWSKLGKDEQKSVRGEAEEELKLQQAVLQSAEAASIAMATTSLDEAVEAIKNRFPSDRAFRAEMAAEQLNEEILRRALDDELRVEAILAKVAGRAEEPSPSEINEFYQTHQEHFQVKETRAARHILITINPDFAKNTRQEARRRIEDIRRRLERDPQQFADTAKQHSECPSALKGGDLGFVERGKLYPELDEALFTLEPQEISQVVESDMGFHLITCDEIRPAAVISGDEAAPEIQRVLRLKKQRQYQKEWLARLR